MVVTDILADDLESCKKEISIEIPKQEKSFTKNFFDMNGKLISTIAETAFAAGPHQLKWNGVHVKTGVYVLRLQAGNYIATKKLVVVK